MYSSEVGQRGTNASLMAKFNLKVAYRNVPVHLDDRWLLGMIWEDQLLWTLPLPFGLRSVPWLMGSSYDQAGRKKRGGPVLG